MATEEGMMVNHISIPKGDVIIRKAAPQDAASLRELRMEALRMHPEAFAADLERIAAEGSEVWAERLGDYATSQSGAICIATCRDRLLGMSGIGRGHWPKTRHFGTLWSVYVKPEWRSCHIGAALVNGCLDWANENGLVVVNLGVNVANKAAIQCYQCCGFNVYGVEPRSLCVNGVYHDELLMAKLL
jgi:RimJ/RimL family protein N-acetyltransferase